MDVELFGAEQKRLHRPTGHFASLSFCVSPDTVYLVEDEKDIPKALRRVRNGLLIFHNAAFDICQLRRWAKVPDGDWWDTLIVERELYGGYYDNFALDDLCRRWLGKYLPKEDRKLFDKAEKMNSRLRRYAAADAAVTLQIYQKQSEEYNKVYAKHDIWRTIDRPALYAFLDFRGMMLDVPAWKALIVKNKKEQDRIRKELNFNPGSWQQVQVALKAEHIKVSSTGEEEMEKHKDNPLVRKILEYRYYAKCVGTYGENFLKMVEADGRIHAHFNVVGAETGRTSSSSPNFQNIPIRDGKQFRECFIAPRGRRLVIADFSQQEPRINAYLAHDEKAIDIFKRGEDVYIGYGEEILGEKIEKSDPRRKIMKPLVLGLAYGLSKYGLAQRTGVSVEEAERLIQRLRMKFPAQAQHIDQARERAGDWVVTPAGRRVWLNHYSNQWVNNVLNAPVQGGAADGVKIATADIRKEIYKKKLDAFFVNSVHDEILVETSVDCAKQIAQIVRDGMITAAEAICPGVPFDSDVFIGGRWSDKDDPRCKVKFHGR
jgi:DNA polymerase-1